ncbi:DUF4442 domain-containing protein [Shewanella surugensis]|uniref:DUF4442 domain-containing protein n=1 Tax=Shewanella surugensis TaxID=212020 RepID=A0ABT0L904_9GAMM|nr:DUF4442 domain-containing protein [Shewanella surugensis]MCL1123850.1 DUF4442 domain-containing protein [Shewanella surugensis]
MTKSKQKGLGWQSLEQNIYDYMGLKYCCEPQGRYRVHVPLTEKTANHFDSFHAAFQFATAESLGGIVIFETRAEKHYTPLVRSVTIDFKKPAMTDLFAEAVFSTADALKMNQSMREFGRYDFKLNIELKNIADEVVSILTADYAVRILPSK